MSEEMFGVIVANRDFFPDELARQGRQTALDALDKMGYDTVCPGPDQTNFGAVETHEDVRACVQLFREHEDDIDGILVTLPNFGDEKAAAETLRRADLDVPVLVHAIPDALEGGEMGQRRDSFCGKISVCNCLDQYDIPFSLTDRHVVDPDSDEFAREVDRFAAVCRVVNGLRRVRVGAFGTRPTDFNTMRCSEKILERSGIAVEPVDLTEIVAAAEGLEDDDARVERWRSSIDIYCDTDKVPEDRLDRMARLGVAIDEFCRELDLDAYALQCWTSLEENFGVAPCTVMSMMSDAMRPAACEVDVGGALAMYALGLASETPSALLDWNNNYDDADEKCVLFHCSNIPAHFLQDVTMSTHDIVADEVGEEAAWGTCSGRIKSGQFTFARLSTDDMNGRIRTYLGRGEFTDDPLATFGGYSVARIPRLQELMQRICRTGFEHHVAITGADCAEALAEAFTTYLNYETYVHEGE